MGTVFKFLCGVIFSCFGFMLGLLVAPFAAVALVVYMTKISFEIGYRGDDPVENIKETCKNIKDCEN